MSEKEEELCTYAVTGENAIFQSIYVCKSCFPRSLMCLCESCAQHCHVDCKGLTYMGVGPSYCDCHHRGGSGCQLLEKSKTALLNHGSNQLLSSTSTPTSDVLDYKVYQIPSLMKEEESSSSTTNDDDDFIEQAKTLISHTKETHWLTTTTKEDDELCGLERLVLAILKQHIQDTDDDDIEMGAEWWVQVSSSNENEQKGVVDLHYDKDERLASMFGLGHFPSISTVTYLTGSDISEKQLPTIVFPHSYVQEIEMKHSDVLLSYPKRGKHLQFHGTYLHGVPYLPNHTGTVSTRASTTRVTLLVNLWKSWKPLGIQSLPSHIRQSILQQSSSTTTFINHDRDNSNHPFWVESTSNVTTIPVTSTENNDDPFYLPFVSKDATWIDDYNDNDDEEEEKEEDDQLVVALYPPPLPTRDGADTIIYKYSEDLAPQFYYLDNKNDDDDEEEEE